MHNYKCTIYDKGFTAIFYLLNLWIPLSANELPKENISDVVDNVMNDLKKETNL